MGSSGNSMLILIVILIIIYVIGMSIYVIYGKIKTHFKKKRDEKFQDNDVDPPLNGSAGRR